MAVFTIGDLHLSFGTDKPMDIFRGWDNYVERLEQNWNYMVGDDDTVVIAGDVSWAMKLENTADDFRFINDTLNGNKIILKGNHDYWWETYSKMNAFLSQQGFDRIKILSNNAYRADDICVCGSRGWINDTGAPFDKKIVMREAGRLELSIQAGKKLGGEIIAFLHYPPIFASEENYDILDVLQKNGIKDCYYGHVHGGAQKRAFTGVKYGIDFHMISADSVEFTPIRVNSHRI